jgi:CHAP domain
MLQPLSTLRSKSRRAVTIVVALVIATQVVASQSVLAVMSPQQKRLFRENVKYFDIDVSQRCAPSSTTSVIGNSANTNLDYKGDTILNEEQLRLVAENKPFYEKSAKKYDLPWAMLAVIHYRESKLRRANPGANYEGYLDGVYQIYKSGLTNSYPEGPITDDDFQTQTDKAAEFIRNQKIPANYERNRNVTANSDADAIKDTFLSYNGGRQTYAPQAASLGFDPETQAYEGSHYVMNMADSQRDPSVNPDWKQAFGGVLKKAGSDYGAYVLYASLTGATISGDCESQINGPVREKVVALAKQELALWKSGQMNPGNDYQKYSQGTAGDWCAWFASWIYNQAGYPIKESSREGIVGTVSEIKAIGIADERFTFHPKGSYTPIPGDMLIQEGHVNIVVAYNAKGVNGPEVTVIGGNQSGSNGYTTSAVTQYNQVIDKEINLGFVSPKQ